jgi:hypothetical protein
MKDRAVIWVNWGTSEELMLQRSTKSAEAHTNADFFVISDSELHLPESVKRIPHQFSSRGFARKAEALAHAVPGGYSTYLFLDADTVVLDDISFGFEQAKRFGIAIAAAPTYLLDEYHRTAEILEKEGIGAHGQLLFSTGVFFFSHEILESGLFDAWLKLTEVHQLTMRGDQELLTVALELRNINPYVLSKSYNTRGRYDTIIGKTRIWHQKSPVPAEINQYEKAYPPRILARGKIANLRLKDTYGGWFRYLRLNIHSITSPKSALNLLREILSSRKWQ